MRAVPWLLAVFVAGTMARAQQPIVDRATATALPGSIDAFVRARLERLNLAPAGPSSDAVFVRRASLDAIGTLPTAEEAREFLVDPDPDKRRRLVDRLLARDEFADYWAMKWGDLLRVKSEFPINLWPNAVQAYHRWIRTSIRDNVPYDRFVRELLTESGSNFRVPQVNFYRAVQSREPQALAQAVVLTFMGTRADAWPADRLAGAAAFFSQVGYKSTREWKEEVVFFDRDKAWTGGRTGSTRSAALPDGTVVALAPDDDPREVFARWLITPDNPWFTRTIVNRLWCWLMGRGIVHEPDDLRPDNRPGDPELLAYLERELVAAQYDLKHLFRLILNSTTYQQSSVSPRAGVGGDGAFAQYQMRPLEAEVLIDVLNQITGSAEQYSSPIPEPYTFIPARVRSIALADGSITSPFLEIFGRSARDTGLESERSPQPTAASRLYLFNSSQVQRKFDQSARLRVLTQGQGDIRPMITTLYLTILSRRPTADELQIAATYAQSAGSRRTAGLDLAWALVNSAEFLYRH
jgi:hypothetical protein